MVLFWNRTRTPVYQFDTECPVCGEQTIVLQKERMFIWAVLFPFWFHNYDVKCWHCSTLFGQWNKVIKAYKAIPDDKKDKEGRVEFEIPEINEYVAKKIASQAEEAKAEAEENLAEAPTKPYQPWPVAFPVAGVFGLAYFTGNTDMVWPAGILGAVVAYMIHIHAKSLFGKNYMSKPKLTEEGRIFYQSAGNQRKELAGIVLFYTVSYGYILWSVMSLYFS